MSTKSIGLSFKTPEKAARSLMGLGAPELLLGGMQNKKFKKELEGTPDISLPTSDSNVPDITTPEIKQTQADLARRRRNAVNRANSFIAPRSTQSLRPRTKRPGLKQKLG